LIVSYTTEHNVTWRFMLFDFEVLFLCVAAQSTELITDSNPNPTCSSPRPPTNIVSWNIAAIYCPSLIL